ncbi:MAG: divalent metal cation transporter [Verrucomicrobia bacterium]|nr:divalent metal cation transporter [Verrucomicrobiota bacterium]MCF7708550.1 divalent metal cation transporter [Verrucomicrobiota bacterium]
MTKSWDPEKVRQEEALLQGLEGKSLITRIRGYFNLTGPAWAQSAMTLGAGSAAASVVAGAFFGYQLLWVQPIAMFLGVFMLAALSNITLTKGERAYLIVRREIHPGLALMWALATVIATVIWHFGQYALLGGAFWDLANVAGIHNAPESNTTETIVRFAGGFLILGVNIYLTWNYGSKPKGIKAYEVFLRWMIRLVMLSFLIVVIVQITEGKVDWGRIFKGFFTFQIPNQEGSLTTILGAIGAAVGINMTFLYPYSILAKGWGKHHKGLARYDLVATLFVPYLILTSLIIIGMASTMHQPPFGTILGDSVTTANFQPVDASQSLGTVLGTSLGRIVFDLGFMGMACGAISAHMICCGFTVCEMFGLEYTPARYRLFTLTPAIGVLGVMIKSPIWLPVIASAIAFTMLPIAYISFFILNNNRSYLGAAVGRGWKRTVVNVILLIAVIMSLIGASIKIKSGVIDKIGKLFGNEPAKEQVEQEGNGS